MLLPMPILAALLATADLPADAPIAQLAKVLGPNDLPYAVPIHPTLVHFTIGLFVIAIAFDIAGALYPIEKRIFRFLALPITRGGFHDVGWYNLLACAVITFFTVAAGFFEMLLAVPIPGVTSTIGLQSMETMLWHGVGGAFRMIQLCYAIEREESALVWVLGRGFFHDGVDHGGYDGPTQRAPILVPGAGRSTAGLRARFQRESARLDPALASFVLERIDEYEVLNPKPASRRARFRREDWQMAGADRTAQMPD